MVFVEQVPVVGGGFIEAVALAIGQSLFESCCHGADHGVFVAERPRRHRAQNVGGKYGAAVEGCKLGLVLAKTLYYGRVAFLCEHCRFFCEAGGGLVVYSGVATFHKPGDIRFFRHVGALVVGYGVENGRL